MTGKRGRPQVGPVVEVRLPTGLVALIDDLASEHDCSRAEMIRRLIKSGLRHTVP